MAKEITIKELNALIKKTIHKKTVQELPFDKEISPKKTSVTVKIGNCYQMETSLGPCIAASGDIMGLCALFKHENITGWQLYKFWQQKPKSWFEAYWLLDLFSARVGSKAKLKKFVDEINDTDLMDDDSPIAPKLEKLIATLETKVK